MYFFFSFLPFLLIYYSFNLLEVPYLLCIILETKIIWKLCWRRTINSLPGLLIVPRRYLSIFSFPLCESSIQNLHIMNTKQLEEPVCSWCWYHAYLIIYNDVIWFPDILFSHLFAELLLSGDCIWKLRLVIWEAIEVKKDRTWDSSFNMLFSWFVGSCGVWSVEDRHIVWFFFD